MVSLKTPDDVKLWFAVVDMEGNPDMAQVEHSEDCCKEDAYVSLYDYEAQAARIEKLEWLAEVLDADFGWLSNLISDADLLAPGKDEKSCVKRWGEAQRELADIKDAALRAAAEQEAAVKTAVGVFRWLIKEQIAHVEANGCIAIGRAESKLRAAQAQRVAELEAFKARVMEWARGNCGACGTEPESEECRECRTGYNIDEFPQAAQYGSNWTPPQAWEVDRGKSEG